MEIIDKFSTITFTVCTQLHMYMYIITITIHEQHLHIIQYEYSKGGLTNDHCEQWSFMIRNDSLRKQS